MRFPLLMVGCLILVTVAWSEEAVDGEFSVWRTGLREEALKADISEATFDAAFAGVAPDEKVIELDRNQPEFTMTFGRYLEIVAPDRRVREGRKKLVENRELLEQIQSQYGVQPRFVVALWGVESDFGKRQGTFSTIQALATLAYDGRRSAFFRGELMHALHILEDGHVAPDAMLSSWAGALGQPQFMPSSFRGYAVDQDGDSRADIWGTVPDVLGSAANYLSSHGWQSDRTWGREVELPRGFDRSLLEKKGTRRKLADWQALGVRRVDGSDLPQVDITARLFQLDPPEGPVFVGYSNHDTILKWNRSDYFATGVGILSDRIAGR